MNCVKHSYLPGFYYRKTPAQVFSCDFCMFREHLQAVIFRNTAEPQFLPKGCVRCIFDGLLCISKEGTCKIRKNVFHFSSKAVFILEIM